MRRLLLAALMAVALLAVNVAAASAAPSDPFQWKSFITGIPGSFGFPEQTKLAVNHETGDILILEGSLVRQLGPKGEPVNFAFTGTNTIPLEFGGESVFVDNSGGATQGYIWVFAVGFPGGETVEAFKPKGEGFGFKQPLNEGTAEFINGGALDPQGRFWLFNGGYGSLENQASQIAPNGTIVGTPKKLEPGPKEAFNPLPLRRTRQLVRAGRKRNLRKVQRQR